MKPGTASEADNPVFPNGPTLVDLEGLTVKLTDGSQENIFAPSSSSQLPSDIYVVLDTTPSGTETSGTVEFTLTAAVPEPSTWAMVILGFLGLGLTAYRKKIALPLA